MAATKLPISSSQVKKGAQFETTDGMLVTVKTFCVEEARKPVDARIRAALFDLSNQDVTSVSMSREDWGPLTFSSIGSIKLIPLDDMTPGTFRINFM